MNKTFYLLSLVFVCLLYLSGCKTIKKATKTNTNVKTETNIEQNTAQVDKVKEEKNLNIETETVITETQYYKPDSIISTTTTITNNNGAVKSEKTTVIKTKQVDKGKVETEHKEHGSTNIENKTKEKVKGEVTEKTKRPIQWGWIFGCLAIVGVGIFFLSKSPVWIFIKKLLKP